MSPRSGSKPHPSWGSGVSIPPQEQSLCLGTAAERSAACAGSGASSSASACRRRAGSDRTVFRARAAHESGPCEVLALRRDGGRRTPWPSEPDPDQSSCARPGVSVATDLLPCLRQLNVSCKGGPRYGGLPYISRRLAGASAPPEYFGLAHGQRWARAEVQPLPILKLLCRTQRYGCPFDFVARFVRCVCLLLRSRCSSCNNRATVAGAAMDVSFALLAGIVSRCHEFASSALGVFMESRWFGAEAAVNSVA